MSPGGFVRIYNTVFVPRNQQCSQEQTSTDWKLSSHSHSASAKPKSSQTTPTLRRFATQAFAHSLTNPHSHTTSTRHS